MNREVLDALDHRFLNKEVPEFAPDSDNGKSSHRHLASSRAKTQVAQLHRVRVYETPDLFVDVYGEIYGE